MNPDANVQGTAGFPVTCTGEYFYRLIKEPSWVERRVQTIEMVDGENWTQRVSIDVDMGRLQAIAESVGVRDAGHLSVPLSILKKGLMLDFSASDENGRPLAILASERSASIWQSVLLYALWSHGTLRTMQSQFSLQVVASFANDLLRVVGPIDACRRLRISDALLQEKSNYALLLAIRHHLNATTVFRADSPRWKAWEMAFALPDFAGLLKCAVANFVLIAEIPTNDSSNDEDRRRRVFKYSLRESRTFPSPLRGLCSSYFAQARERRAASRYDLAGKMTTMLSFLGGLVWHSTNVWKLVAAVLWKLLQWALSAVAMQAYAVRLDTSLVGHASREHVRLVCPPGVCMAGPLRSSKQSKFSQSDEIRGRVTRGRAMLYTKIAEPSFDPSQLHEVRALMRPRLTGFLTPAIVSLAISLFLSFISWKQASRTILSDHSTLDALTTVLLLSASLSSLYVARADEHKYRCRMLTVPRTGIAASGVAVGFIAVAAIFDQSVGFVEFVAHQSFLFSLGVSVFLFVFWGLAKISKERVERKAEVTVDLNHSKAASDDRPPRIASPSGRAKGSPVLSAFLATAGLLVTGLFVVAFSAFITRLWRLAHR